MGQGYCHQRSHRKTFLTPITATLWPQCRHYNKDGNVSERKLPLILMSTLWPQRRHYIGIIVKTESLVAWQRKRMLTTINQLCHCYNNLFCRNVNLYNFNIQQKGHLLVKICKIIAAKSLSTSHLLWWVCINKYSNLSRQPATSPTLYTTMNTALSSSSPIQCLS